jgi:hypothetical protein
MYYQWWLIDENNELEMWKLGSIQMKIFDDIAYNLNWIEKNSNSNELKFN